MSTIRNQVMCILAILLVVISLSLSFADTTLLRTASLEAKQALGATQISLPEQHFQDLAVDREQLSQVRVYMLAAGESVKPPAFGTNNVEEKEMNMTENGKNNVYRHLLRSIRERKASRDDPGGMCPGAIGEREEHRIPLKTINRPHHGFLPDNCPDEAHVIQRFAYWRAQEAKNKSLSQVWRIAFVGANKGYPLAAILTGLGVPNVHPFILAQQIHDYVSAEGQADNRPKRDGDSLCGGCCDCARSAPEPIKYRDKAIPPGERGSAAYCQYSLVMTKTPPPRIIVEAFEPLSANVKWLHHFFLHQLSLNDRRGEERFPLVDLRINKAVVGARPGKYFLKEKSTHLQHVGYEVWKIRKKNILAVNNSESEIHTVRRARRRADDRGDPTNHISMVTLDDALFAAYNSTRRKANSELLLDVLITDAEGADYSISDGAKKLLHSARVGLYMFECHDTKRSVKAQVRWRGTDAFSLCEALSPRRRANNIGVNRLSLIAISRFPTYHQGRKEYFAKSHLTCARRIPVFRST